MSRFRSKKTKPPQAVKPTAVKNGIKYAVYTNSNGTGNPVGVGYVTANDIDKDIPIYTGFTVDSTVRQYYIFIWMDGYVTDESHAELPFGGYIHASVMQSE